VAAALLSGCSGERAKARKSGIFFASEGGEAPGKPAGLLDIAKSLC